MLALLLIINSSSPLALANQVASEEEQPAVYRYVSLGDFLTVGYEPGAKSNYGFAHRLFEQALLNGRAYFYGINGLKSSGLRKLLESVIAEKEIVSADIQENFPDGRADTMLSKIREVKEDLQQADLITITIAGNDCIYLLSEVQTSSQEEIEKQLNRD